MQKTFQIKTTLIIILILFNLKTSFSQVGIGTDNPKTTLQVEGEPTNTTTTDGLQTPSLTLAQLDAKVSAYGTDQNGAILYIDDISAGSTTTETAEITSTGYYFYDATNIKWIALNSGNSSTTTYAVGDFAQGGIVFWVDETGEHGLVCTKFDLGTEIRWYAGTNGNTQAKGDGPFSGETNTKIIISSQVAIGDDGSTYAARMCNELQVTEGGKTYGDWYLPSKEELYIMYLNKTTIDATATSNGGTSLGNGHWSSTEATSSTAWLQSFVSGAQVAINKSITCDNLRAIRAF